MFVESQWLEEHVSDRGIRIVDLRFSRCFSNHEKVAEECRKDYLGRSHPKCRMASPHGETQPVWKGV